MGFGLKLCFNFGCFDSFHAEMWGLLTNLEACFSLVCLRLLLKVSPRFRSIRLIMVTTVYRVILISYKIEGQRNCQWQIIIVHTYRETNQRTKLVSKFKSYTRWPSSL